MTVYTLAENMPNDDQMKEAVLMAHLLLEAERLRFEAVNINTGIIDALEQLKT
jgi:hypothetical protein